MMIMLAFLCRLLVFVLLSIFSTLANREYNLTLYGRILISTLQVFIFCTGMMVYEVCGWIMRGMSSVDLYTTVDEGRTGGVEMDGSENQHDMVGEGDRGDSASVVSVVLEDGTASQVAHMSHSIVFADGKALRDHVWWVYLLGILMFSTIYCLDFTLLSVSFFFSIGLLLGWMVQSVYRFRESTLSKFLRLLYFIFIGLLVLLYVGTHRSLLDPGAEMRSRDAMIVIVTPTLTGMGWMYMPHKEMTKTIQTSFFTCCLLCLPVLVIVDTSQFQTIFDAAPPEVLVYLLAVEPILKAMAVYTIALSLEMGRKLDLLIVLFVVTHLNDMLFHVMPHAVMACTVTVMTLLVVMHLFCLVLTTTSS